MSYGFEVLNNNGVVLANSTDFNYGLVTSGQVTTNSLGNMTISYSNTTEQPLIFVRNASNAWVSLDWSLSTQAQFSTWEPTPSGYSFAYGPFRQPLGNVTFQYKIFAPFRYLGNVAGQDYGIQIYNDSSQKTFDSNYEIPLITNTGTITIPNPSTGTPSPVSQIALPSGITGNPWFSITSISNGTGGNDSGSWVPDLILGVQYRLIKCVRVDNGNFQLSTGARSFAVSTPYTWLSGANTQKLFYFQNVVSTPLEGIVSPWPANSTSCSYDPNSASNCYVGQGFNAIYSGGNATTVTYNWSLVNNTGTFSISTLYGSTSSVVYIDNTKADTTVTDGSPTIYNGTVQCIISQNGSTPVTAQLAVSSSHLASASPLAGGAITASSVTSSCSYTGSGGTCTTSETHTVGTVTGGNGTAITYSWDFAANAGGFSFSTGTTGTAVGITRTAGAGTYTCTTRCTISQTGMTPLVVTYSVSHTHTESAGAVINPLGFGGGVYETYAEGGETIYLDMYPNGTWTINGSGLYETGNWWSTAPVTGIGNGYWVKFEVIPPVGSQGSGNNTPTTDWQQLNVGRWVYVSTTADFFDSYRSVQYNIKISNSYNGTVLSNTNVYLTANAQYGGIGGNN